MIGVFLSAVAYGLAALALLIMLSAIGTPRVYPRVNAGRGNRRPA